MSQQTNDARQIGSDAIDAFLRAIRTHEPNNYLPHPVTLEALLAPGSGVAALMKRRALAETGNERRDG